MESVPGALNENRAARHLYLCAEAASPSAHRITPAKSLPGEHQEWRGTRRKGGRCGARGQAGSGGDRAARGWRSGVRRGSPGRRRTPAPVAGGLGRAGEEREGRQDGTFELGQRRELHLAALAAELRGALRALLPLSLAHRFPCEAIHFLRGRDGRRHGWAVRRRGGTSLSRSIY